MREPRNAIVGVAHSDPAVAAQLTIERGCHTVGDAFTSTVRTLLQRVDTGGFGGGSIAAVLAEIPVVELGQSIGRQCGRELIGAEYTRVITTVNAMESAGGAGHSLIEYDSRKNNLRHKRFELASAIKCLTSRPQAVMRACSSSYCSKERRVFLNVFERCGPKPRLKHSPELRKTSSNRQSGSHSNPRSVHCENKTLNWPAG